jgi:hypothetical protein
MSTTQPDGDGTMQVREGSINKVDIKIVIFNANSFGFSIKMSNFAAHKVYIK